MNNVIQGPWGKPADENAAGNDKETIDQIVKNINKLAKLHNSLHEMLEKLAKLDELK